MNIKNYKNHINSLIKCQMSHVKCQSAFTLIEVLVAATLVGILSTIGVTGFQAITRNGRDALRKSDLEQIRSALEIYKSENNVYPPIISTCIAELNSDYINPYPADPKPAQYQYCYVPDVTRLKYTVCAHLENGTSGDYSSDCGGSNSCTASCNYKVVNP